MKQELSDLIPARGLFEVTKRADQELDKNANQCIRREISLSEFNWITLKDTAYCLLVGAYNLSIFYGIYRTLQN